MSSQHAYRFTARELHADDKSLWNMSDAERALLLAVYHRTPHAPGERGKVTVRDVCNDIGVFKQNCYYLKKWCRRGWYDYGVSLDLGWLTPRGLACADDLSAYLEREAPNAK